MWCRLGSETDRVAEMRLKLHEWYSRCDHFDRCPRHCGRDLASIFSSVGVWHQFASLIPDVGQLGKSLLAAVRFDGCED